MNQITTALTPAQVAAIEAKQAAKAASLTAAAPEQEQSTNNAPAAPQAIRLANGAGRSKNVALQWPLEIDGELVDHIALRRLTGADFKMLASFQDVEDENAALLSLMSGLAAETFAALDADDYANLSEEARDFLPQKLKAEIARISETGGHTVR